jgi:hypothetical protein
MHTPYLELAHGKVQVGKGIKCPNYEGWGIGLQIPVDYLPVSLG